MVNTKSKSRIFLFALLVLIFCLCTIVIGVFIHAYTSNYNVPVFSDMVEKVENVLISEEAFNQMIAEEFESLMNNPKALLERNNEYQSYSLDLDSVFTTDVQGIKLDIQGQGEVKGSTDNKVTSFESLFKFGVMGFNFEAGFDFRIFANDNQAESFVKIKNIPSFLTMSAPNYEQISNKWIYMQQEYREENSSSIDIISQLNQEQKDKLVTLVKSKEFLSLITRSSDRVFNDVRTNCVAVNFDKAKFLPIAKNYSDATEDQTFYASVSASDDFEVKSEICFGRKDKMLHYMEFTFENNTTSLKIVADNVIYSTNPIELEKPEIELDFTDINLEALFQQEESYYQI